MRKFKEFESESESKEINEVKKEFREKESKLDFVRISKDKKSYWIKFHSQAMHNGIVELSKDKVREMISYLQELVDQPDY